MKKFITLLTIIAAVILMFSVSVNAAVTLSNPSSPPTSEVAILQTNNLGSGIQARNRASNSSDWRAITQTFTWNSEKDIAGLGLYMHSSQTAWSADQNYVLVIQALNGNSPTLDVAEIEFSLTSSYVGPSQWLYIDFDDIELQNGATYGFSFCPPASAVNGSLRTVWNVANADVLTGISRQYSPNPNGIPKTDSYSSGGGVNDYTLYMTTKPDPITLSNPLDIPTEHVIVVQSNTAGSLHNQARNRSAGGGDWRAITQTFEWKSDAKLDKIGLYLANESGNNWSADQRYLLVIQALNGNSPTLDVAELEFTLASGNMGASQWLCMDLVDDLALANNQWYGFTLCPPLNAVDAGLRSYWATADGGGHYPGIGSQDNPDSSGMPKTTSYGSAGTDHTMYMTDAIPEPALFSLLGLGFVAFLMRKK